MSKSHFPDLNLSKDVLCEVLDLLTVGDYEGAKILASKNGVDLSLYSSKREFKYESTEYE